MMSPTCILHQYYCVCYCSTTACVTACVTACGVVVLMLLLRALLFGLSDGDAKEAVSSTCRAALLHAGEHPVLHLHL